MLEKIAGPFNLRLVDGRKVNVYVDWIFWDDDLGFVFNACDGGYTWTSFTHIAQLDGISYMKMEYASGSDNPYGNGYNFMRTTYNNDLLWSNNEGTVLRFNKSTFFMEDVTNAYPLVDAAGFDVNGGAVLTTLLLPDRQMYVYGPKLYSRDRKAGSTYGVEFDIGTSYVYALFPTNISNVIIIIIGYRTSSSNCKVIFYNTLLRKEVMSRLVLPKTVSDYGTFHYSKRFGVFIVHDRLDNEVYNSAGNTFTIYASSEFPAILSTPVSVTPITKGKVSKIMVRLTGAEGYPCVGELINWGVSGAGSLSTLQSETDEQGYAYTNFIAPFDLSNFITITANVVF